MVKGMKEDETMKEIEKELANIRNGGEKWNFPRLAAIKTGRIFCEYTSSL